MNRLIEEKRQELEHCAAATGCSVSSSSGPPPGQALTPRIATWTSW